MGREIVGMSVDEFADVVVVLLDFSLYFNALFL